MDTWLSVSALILLGLCHVSCASPLLCYFTHWSQFRQDEGRYTADDVPANLCTHVIFAFAKLSDDQIIRSEWNDEDYGGDTTMGNYAKVMAAKDVNPGLKVLLAIGGWNAGTTEFTNTVSTAEHRAAFIQNAITYLELWGFDGLDLDWEYPAQRGSPAGDRELFTLWVKEIQEGFSARSLFTGRDRLLLTAAVKIGETSTTSYEIDQIGSYLDYVGLMTYDLYGSFNKAQGVYSHTPLPEVKAAVTQWIDAGFLKEKLVMGIATYGKSYTLTNSANTAPRSSFTEGGQPGLYTGETGFLSYYEVCSKIRNDGWTEVYHEETQTPYAYKGDQWVGFENVQSVVEKVALIKSQGLAGAMVWSLPSDDFNNLCGDGAYPLITAVKGALDRTTDPTTPTPSADTGVTTSTIETTTSNVAAEETTTSSTGGADETSKTGDKDGTTQAFSCVGKEGYYPNPADCSKFFVCEIAHVDGESKPRVYTHSFDCPDGLVFDPAYEVCLFPGDAGDITCTVVATSSSTGSETTTTPNSSGDDTTTTIDTDSKTQAFSCVGKEGYYPNPDDCSKFFVCEIAHVDDEPEPRVYTHSFDCPGGLVFDQVYEVCNWPSDVPSCQ